MNIRFVFASAILVSGLLLSPLLAAGPVSTSFTDDVALRSTRSVTEIGDYVKSIERRMQSGRYDVADKGEQQWIVNSINSVRAALATADPNAPPSEDLQALAGAFETGMIKVEEGGIMCRQERRTGTRMITLRCYSAKRLQEDILASQDQLREIKRPQKLPHERANGGFGGS